MTLKEFLKHLEGGRLLPAYVLAGEAEVSLSRALAALRQRALGEADPLLAFSRLDAKDLPAAAIFDEVRTLPLSGKRRLVEVRRAQPLLARPGPRQPSPIEEYLRHPASSGVLALLPGELDWRRTGELEKRLGQAGVLVDCGAPRAAGMGPWIEAEARARGLKIAPAAVQLLAQRVGSDLDRASTALDQLGLFRLQEEIRPADVAALVAADREENVFDLAGALGARDRRRALAILRGAESDSPDGALGPLAWIIRHLAEARRLALGGAREEELVRALRLPPARAREYAALARRFAPGELEVGLRRLLEADLALKTGRLEAGLALDLLVLGLAAPRG